MSNVEGAAAAGARGPRRSPCCPPLTERPLTAEEAERTAAMFKALGDPVRLRLFSLVASHEGGEACVCDISDVGRLPADGLAPPEEAEGGRPAHLRAARHLGLLPGRAVGGGRDGEAADRSCPCGLTVTRLGAQAVVAFSFHSSQNSAASSSVSVLGPWTRIIVRGRRAGRRPLRARASRRTPIRDVHPAARGRGVAGASCALIGLRGVGTELARGMPDRSSLDPPRERRVQAHRPRHGSGGVDHRRPQRRRHASSRACRRRGLV